MLAVTPAALIIASVVGIGDAVPASKAASRLQDVSDVRQLLATLAGSAATGSRN